MASIEVSSKPGEGRAVWMDEKGEALKALAPLLADAKRPKIVHDPKLFQFLAGRVANVQHATQIYSYLVRPTTGNHNFTDVVMRQFNVDDGRRTGRARGFSATAGAVAEGAVEEAQVLEAYEKIDLPVAAVIAEMERTGIRVDPRRWMRCRDRWKRKCGGWKRKSGNWRAMEFNVNSPTQLAEILFDKLSTAGAFKRGEAGK